jgi:hypothetical protein
MQKKSMNYFFGASDGSPNSLRVHPLLLSLTAAFAKSDKSPDIGSVSEDDPRVSSSCYYTAPSDLPPLNIHFPGQNGTAHHSDSCGFLLPLAALCQEFMVSEPQDNVGAHDAEMNAPLPLTDTEPIPSIPVDNLADAGDSMTNVHSKGKKCWCVSSVAVNSESFNTPILMGPCIDIVAWFW